MNNSTTVEGRRKILRTKKCFSRIKNITGFDRKFKRSPWRSRTSGNLIRSKKFQKGCEWSACFHGALSLCKNGKAYCERPFALQRQQPEKHKKNVDVASPECNCGRP